MIHALVDALGNPVRLRLSPGQTHEMKVAYELLADVRDAYVVGDGAYGARPLVDQLLERNCTVVLAANPTHKQRDFDRHLYRERYLLEHFFQKIKRLRRIAMRFERLARNSLGFVQLAAVLVWLL
jgi:transposase